jgi:hypothetical protein
MVRKGSRVRVSFRASEKPPQIGSLSGPIGGDFGFSALASDAAASYGRRRAKPISAPAALIIVLLRSSHSYAVATLPGWLDPRLRPRSGDTHPGRVGDARTAGGDDRRRIGRRRDGAPARGGDRDRGDRRHPRHGRGCRGRRHYSTLWWVVFGVNVMGRSSRWGSPPGSPPTPCRRTWRPRAARWSGVAAGRRG